MASDTARIFGAQWDSSLVEATDKSERYHAITSEKTGDVVVRTADNSNQTSWLCDYLEAVSPGSVVAIIERLLTAEALLAELEKQESVARVSEESFSTDGTSDILTVNLPIGMELYTRAVPRAASRPESETEKELTERLFALRSSAIASGDENVFAWDNLVCAVFCHFKGIKLSNHVTPVLNGGIE